MGHDAVLSVLVKVDNIMQAVAQVEALEHDLDRAGDASDKLGSSSAKTARTVGDMGGSARDASKHVQSLGKDIEGARKATDLWQDSQGRWRNSTGQFATAAERAAAGVRKLGGEFDGLHAKKSKTDDLIKKNVGTFGSFSNAVNATRNGVTALGGGFGGLATTAVLLAPILLALVGAAVALVAALAPLVGLAGAAAVGLSAFGQAAGVVALASMGVGGALKEQMDATGKAGKAALSGADQQRSAARAIAAAQDGVRMAHERVRAATEQLQQAEKAERDALNALAPARQQARRDLEDLRSSYVGAVLDQRQAAVGLKEAQRALADALKPADVVKLADAQAALTNSTLSEQGAVLSLTDARQRLDDLMKPADALTVADATDAVADATRGQTRAALDLAKAQAAAAQVLGDPTSNDAAKAQAKLDLADAENAVGDAARASQHAQQQLAQVTAGPSSQEIAKAKLDVADAEQAVADATRGTAKAQQAVTDAQKGTDPDAIAKDRLIVAQAEHTLADAMTGRARLEKDLRAAEKAGISGSAGVVAAEQHVADAHLQVADAQRNLQEAGRGVTKALQAVTDAQASAASGAAGAAAAGVDLNQKFNALPPAAQQFVRALQGLKPRLDEIRGVAAAGLFPGVIDGMNSAMGSFDSVKRVVSETSTVLGGLAQKAGELVGSSAFGKDIETIGARNALIIDRLGRAAIYGADALRHVIVAAGPLATWLAKVTEEWAKNADAAVRTARESGALGDFFQSTRNTLIRVVSILGNLAVAFFNVGKAAAPFGRDMLASIDKVTGKFKEWTDSVGGQHALQDFFRESTDLVGKLMPALGSILGNLGSLAFSVLPAYAAILGALGPIAGPLVTAFVAYRIALTAVTVATNLATAAQWLWNAAMADNPIGIIVIAIAALVAGIILAYKNSETFRDIVNAVWTSIKTVAEPVINWLATALPAAWEWIKTATVNVWEFLKPYLAAAWLIIKTAVVTYFTVYKTIIEGVWIAVRTVTTTLWDWFGPYLEAAWKVIKIAVKLYFEAYKTIIETVWAAIKTGADIAWALINAAILDPIRAARDKLGDIWDAIRATAGKAWDKLTTAAGTFASGLKDAITGAFRESANLVVGFVNKIIDVVNLIPGIKEIKHVAKLQDDTKPVSGLARGGAFGATGGLINNPMVFMGEEAPTHPEFVIPTNPAYRGRAHMLLAQAAGAIGLAEGGVFSQQQVADLWKAQGGNASKASDMSWIAMAESHGDAGINYGGGHFSPLGQAGKLASGLYQILGLPFPGDVYDAAVNTRMAIAKSSNGQNLHPWDASRAVWGPHVGGGGPLSKVVSAVTGAVSGALDLLANGASALLGKLPGTDSLGWLKGLGDSAIHSVTDWVKGKAAGLLGGSDVPGGVSGNVQDAIDIAAGLGFAHPSLNQLTGGQHAKDSFHYLGRAADFGAAGHTVGQMEDLFGTFLDHFGSHIKEMFYDPEGYFIKNGAKVPGAIGGHLDHLHIALAQGGMFGGLPFIGKFHSGGIAPREGLAHVAAGERMTPAGQSGGPLVHIENATFTGEQDVETFARTLGWQLAR